MSYNGDLEIVEGKGNMGKLSKKARMYARTYDQLPYGREIEGTAELLLQSADCDTKMILK